MAYHIDDEHTSLDDLRRRIEETDLVPSRVSLLDEIAEKFGVLEQQGITTLAGLRKALKSSGRLAALSTETGIETQYLTLLRREIESYFPKPSPLKDFDWIPEGVIAKLEGSGIRDTAGLYQATSSSEDITNLAQSSGVGTAILEVFACLADLSRVQWVSPATARMLVEAGYPSSASLAAADSGELCDALMRVNADGRFFKGKIGLRDVRRLIRAAGYIGS